jgi:PAS domain-containing protein
METLLDSYIDLYDNAPVGYLTLDRAGTVMQMNLTGARALGIDRARPGQPRFGLFVSPADRTALSDFLASVFANGTAAAREITIERDGHPSRVVQVEASRSADGERCRLVMVDVTARPGLIPPAP